MTHLAADEITRLTAEIERLRGALKCGIRAAKLALFVINKNNVMPNHSWETGFKDDLAEACAGLDQETSDDR